MPVRERRLDLSREGGRGGRRRTAAPWPDPSAGCPSGRRWPPSRISRSRRPTGPVLGSRVAVYAPAPGLQVVDQPVELRGRPGAVDPFEDDEQRSRHDLRKTRPRSTRRAAWRKAESRGSCGLCSARSALPSAPMAVASGRANAWRPRSPPPPTKTTGMCAAWSAPRAASGAKGGGRSRPWSIPTRSRRRSAIQRIRGSASTSAPAWRPSAPSPGERCRAACCLRAGVSTGDLPPRYRRSSGGHRAGAGHRRGGSSGRRGQAGGLVPGDRHRRTMSRRRTASYHLRLRTGPWSYSVRVSHPGLATDIADLRIDRAGDDRRATSSSRPRTSSGAASSAQRASRSAGSGFTPSVPPTIRSAPAKRSTGDDGTFAIGGLDAKRYTLRASKFGWLPETLKWPVAAPATRIGFKLARTGVIEGRVLDADGEGQANATVVALLSAGLGVIGSPIIWTVDTNGRSRRTASSPAPTTSGRATARCWSTRPRRSRSATRSCRSRSSSRCRTRARASVAGSRCAAGGPLDGETRAVLFGRSPLALPRKAVGEIDRDGKFVVGRAAAGALRDLDSRRNRASCRAPAARARSRFRSSPGATVDLNETIVVRPQAEE